MGLAAAGRDPASVRRDGHSVLDSLRGEVATLAGLGDFERTILAARACGASPYSFAGRNLVAEVLRARSADDSFAPPGQPDGVRDPRAARRRALAAHLRRSAKRRGWIERQQNADGGFGFGGARLARATSTTRARRCRRSPPPGARNRRVLGLATGYLTRSQNPDGGFPQQYGGESNAQSTAWAVQGLIAAGRDPAGVRRGGSRSPLGYLESLIAPGGSVRYSRTSAQTPVWVTAQALIALAGKTFPVG